MRGDDWHESVRRVLAVHGQSPLFYLLVRGALALTGESLRALRLVAALAGSLVPLAGFLAARSAFGARAAAVALVLLAFDPALVALSESARPYSLAQLGALAALAGLARASATAPGERGPLRARVLAWSGAVLAVYAHPVFLPLVPALALGALASEERGYRPRAVARDLVLALVVLAPALRHMASLLARRGELAWVEHASLAPLGAVLPPHARWVVLAALVVSSARGYPRVRGALRGRGLLVAAVSAAALTGGALLLLRALGSNIVDERYVALGAATVPLASAWAIASLPRPLAALALGLVVGGGLLRRDAAPPPASAPWREARAAVDALSPREGEPVLLEPGFVEASLVLVPDRAGPELRGFLASPLEDHPGLGPTGLRPALLGRGARRAYFESELLPLIDRLGRGARLFVVATPETERELDAWLAERAPGRLGSPRAPTLSGARLVVSTRDAP